MRIVVGLGGNALLRRGEPSRARLQHEHVVEADQVLARLAARHVLIVTHGNGPQIEEMRAFGFEQGGRYDLETVVRYVRPAILIGTSGTPGAFTEAAIRDMTAPARLRDRASALGSDMDDGGCSGGLFLRGVEGGR